MRVRVRALGGQAMSRTWRRLVLCGSIACGALVPANLPAGIITWPWSPKPQARMSAHQAEREAYYASRACDPIGARQVYKKGKLWPPQPRPTGPANLPSHLYHAAHYWPHPYVAQDRDYVRTLSSAQTSNGWVTMTTLYEYHFDETHQLNAAGRLQVRWILENAPSKHRYLFVQAGLDQSTSELRMNNARSEAVSLVGEEQSPPVLVRVTSPLGRPAEEIDALRRKDRESILSPRITPPIGTNNFGGSAASSNGT